MLGPSRLLTLTRKSKFSKRTCPTQFFEYIPILGPVSSFEVQKLCKRPISKKSWLLCKYWLENQNFQNGPVPLNFSSTFRFWDPFLHSELRNCANVQFPKSWLLFRCWPNVKIFEMDLSCPIFRVHSNFGVRSVIWDLKIAKMTQFQVFKT